MKGRNLVSFRRPEVVEAKLRKGLCPLAGLLARMCPNRRRQQQPPSWVRGPGHGSELKYRYDAKLRTVMWL